MPTIACWIARRGDNDAIALEAVCLMEAKAVRARATIGDVVDIDVAAAAGTASSSPLSVPPPPPPPPPRRPCAATTDGLLVAIFLVVVGI